MKVNGENRAVWFLAIYFAVSWSVSAGQAEGAEKNTGITGYKVIGVYPHDSNAFTEGLLYKDGFLYESTGGNGKSEIRKVELKSGRVVKAARLSKEYFGEGIAVIGGRIYQLTWQSRTGFIYDDNNLQVTGRFKYKTEGWGLTTDGRRLIMSDGSSYLHFMDANTFEPVRHIRVHDKNGPVSRINELEYVKGYIYANVWMTDRIVKISPKTGAVEGEINLGELMKGERPENEEAVLNGIAYDAEGDRIFVTGKFWPKLFEIKLETSGKKQDR
jgi:glutamine cyclotransferase